MLAHMYSNSYIQASETLTEISNTLIHKRYNPRTRIWAESGKPVDIFQEHKALFMDLASAYFFGLENGPNLIENPDKNSVLRNFELGFSHIF